MDPYILQSRLAKNTDDTTETHKALSLAADTLNLFARLIQIKTTAEARFEALINNPAEPHSRDEALLVLEPFFSQFSEGSAQLYDAILLEIPQTMSHFYPPPSTKQITCFDLCLGAVHSVLDWCQESSNRSSLGVNKSLNTEPLIANKKTPTPGPNIQAI